MRYPSGPIESLPEIPLTATQQKWKKAQTDSLVNKRLWKHSEMVFQMEARGVKQWLVMAFGENYIESMSENIPDIDNLLGQADKMAAAIQIVKGGKPFRRMNPGETAVAYAAARSSYMETLADTPFGTHKPDDEQASRLLILLANMREHRALAEQQGKLAATYALKSICKGEVPQPGMIIGLKNSLGSIVAPWQVPKHPLDRGGSSDDPRRWSLIGMENSYRAALWRQLGHPSTNEGGALYESFKSKYGTTHHGINWSSRTATGPETQAPDWYALYTHNFCIQTNTVYDRYGGFSIPLGRERPTAVHECYSPERNSWQQPIFNQNPNGQYTSVKRALGSPWQAQTVAPAYPDVVFIMPLIFFYGKAFGRTSDALTFWETHSKYRLRARAATSRGMDSRGNMVGKNTTLVDIVLVNAITGAPSGKYVTFMRSSKSPQSALLIAKKYFPHLLSINEGNNPRLDSTVRARVADKSWRDAGKQFKSLPESDKSDKVYACVVTSLLEWPDSGIIDQGVFKAYMEDLTKPRGDDYIRMEAFSPYFHKMARDMAGYAPFDYYKDGHGRRTLASKRTSSTGLPFWDGSDNRGTHSAKRNKLFGKIWSDDIQIAKRYNSRFDWTKLTKDAPSRKLAFGVPSTHKGARAFSKLKIYLVPKQIESIMAKIHSDFEQFLLMTCAENDTVTFQSAGTLTGYGHLIRYWDDEQKRRYKAFHVAMHLLNSGNWLLFKSWKTPQSFKEEIEDTVGEDLFKACGLAGNMSEQNVSDAISLLSSYGMNFDTIQEVISVPINDIADVHEIVKGFVAEFGDIRECIVPDFKSKAIHASRPLDEGGKPISGAPGIYTLKQSYSLNSIGHYAHVSYFGGPFCMGVAFGRFFPANKHDDTPDAFGGNFGTYMWRRVPVNTFGLTGERYTRRTMLEVMGKMFKSDQMSVKTHTQQDILAAAGQMGSIAVIGGLAVGSMMLYKYLGYDMKTLPSLRT